jgi:plastocyanin
MERHRAASLVPGWRLPVAVLATGAAVVVPAPPAQAETVNVIAANLAFSPASVTVQLTGNEPGFTALHAHVIWTMTDPSAEHTVTFEDPRLVSSERLANGRRHEAVIPMAGTFAYRCTIHPAMTGSVTVVPGPPEAATTTAPPESSGGVEGRRSGSGSDSETGAAPVIIGAVVLAGLAGLLWLLLRGRRCSSGPEPPE